jgi:hypothetical protein
MAALTLLDGVGRKRQCRSRHAFGMYGASSWTHTSRGCSSLGLTTIRRGKIERELIPLVPRAQGHFLATGDLDGRRRCGRPQTGLCGMRNLKWCPSGAVSGFLPFQPTACNRHTATMHSADEHLVSRAAAPRLAASAIRPVRPRSNMALDEALLEAVARWGHPCFGFKVGPSPRHVRVFPELCGD